MSDKPRSGYESVQNLSSDFAEWSYALEKENKAIKDKIIRDTWNLFEHEEEDYHKPVRAGNFWSNNYIRYISKGNRKTWIIFLLIFII